MWDGLKNWLREQFERADYIDHMIGRYPPFKVWLMWLAAAGALCVLHEIFPTLAKGIAAVVGIVYLVYALFIWAAAGHRPDDWDRF
ncbi:hypothetical protein [Neisseria chenwenguii]|uniref:hypothetical protein n=1 Tax=Neisseria chenwenguii TaxID=1853278 RepID=UPI000F50212F|nr:hypothetical protein [Neisseria chenwenguii]